MQWRSVSRLPRGIGEEWSLRRSVGMIEHALPLEPTPHERSENQTDDERAKTEE